MRKIWVIVSVLLLAACHGSDQENKGKNKSEKEKIVINVEVAESYRGDSVATFKSTAILEADKAATITTKTSGIILDLLVEEGDFVNQGDVLLVLESDEQELSLKSAKANYEKSLNNFQRAQQLISKGLTNKEQLDNLKFETESLRSSLEQARMNLSFTQVKAPFAGMVVKRLVKIGNLIQNATPVYEIVDFNSLQAKIDVPEHQWSIMKAGLPVDFEFDALNNEHIQGEVIRVSPVIDANSGTFQVTVAVDNTDKLLRPGLFAKANVIFDQKNDVVLVDKNAIIREDELSYVYVVDGENQINKVQVELGYEMPNAFEIKGGLSANQQVVTTGKNNLTPDTQINIVNYNEAS
ncbi:MAG: efflux RND transporter periplasmic adaptor subunit [Marinicella sp.]|nr:efflux RND transporter periplasmic adaptor subunit [Xanthomonadales bacterium]